MRTNEYFDVIGMRPDRLVIKDEWIERALRNPLHQSVQPDLRLRRWCVIPETENRVLRAGLLPDGETVEHASHAAGAPAFSYEQVAA